MCFFNDKNDIHVKQKKDENETFLEKHIIILINLLCGLQQILQDIDAATSTHFLLLTVQRSLENRCNFVAKKSKRTASSPVATHSSSKF